MTSSPTALLLALTILTPLLLALPLWWPARREATRRLAPMAALPALLLALLGEEGTTLALPWLLLGTELGLDATGRIFLLLSAWLWLIAAWFATAYLAEDRRAHLFLLFFLAAMAGNFGLIVARDLISFNLFFSLMGLSAYGLVIHRRDPAALRAGRIYLTLVILGEVLIFCGLVGLVWQTGGIVQLTALPAPAGLPPALIACLLLGFGIKAGMVPLHFWLPLAHPAAPIPASAVLSGVMIKAGLLGWLRFLPGDGAGPELGSLCLLLGLVAAGYGALKGLTRDDPKTVLAWSSISQMGLLTVGLGLFLAGGAAREPALAAIQLFAVHHGLAKGALFLAVGVAGRINLREPLLAAAVLLPALSLAGAPLTSGFAAKNLLLEAAAGREFLPPLLSASSLLTALLMLHFLRRLRALRQGEKSAATPAGASGRRLPLAILAISGLPPLWSFLPGLGELTARLPAAGGDKIGAALLPIILALALAGLAGRFRPRPKERDLRPHAAGEPGPEPHDRLAGLIRWWQRHRGQRQNLQAAAEFRRRRWLAQWRQRGRRTQQAPTPWPLAGVCSLGLIILFFLLLRVP
ncbi:complex I subunit 5 family protein [Desulfurivibrio sp. D14AmB]|uniref:complex I subunit 5 family protein n=1 Tax=Desulfurivibrio sp. D14AmB TaxID=3374370 RepID=UPI00376F09C7